jgi:signal transduction histidine kinase
MGGAPDTYFAPAARATPESVARDVACLASNPFVDALLQAAGGLVAVLNQERQVLAVNHALLRMLGVADPEGLVGLRPGEVVGCDHANGPPAGCGTTRHCRTCGAVLSIVGALSTEEEGERKCALTVVRDGQPFDLCLRVRARILRLEDNRRFVVLFLQDVTTQERLSEVQRTFFHDLRNLFLGLQGTTELLSLCEERERVELVDNVAKITARLAAEVDLQQSLAGDGSRVVVGASRPLKAADVIADAAGLVRNHQAAAQKPFEVLAPDQPLLVLTEAVLLSRVLVNMLINAFEASPPGATVRLRAERWLGGGVPCVRFSVWNASVIPDDVRLRVFQRHFSTKADWGRGIGTWSMKLIGEHFLQGKVGFESEAGRGTTFYLDLHEAIGG